MKLVICFIYIILIAGTVSAAECTVENLKRLAVASAELNGQLGAFKIKVNRILNKEHGKKAKISELKKEVLAEIDVTSKQHEPFFSEIDKIVTANPECNINNLFKTTK